MAKRRRSHAAFGFALATLVAGGEAAAQIVPAKQRADAAYQDGLNLAKAGKSDAALEKFEQARALAPSARATFQMAKMENVLGRYDLALLHFRQALRDETLPQSNRDEALHAIDELKTKVGVISLDVPPGAQVSVDGNSVMDPSTPVEVGPGHHVVRATLGADARTVETTLEAGKAVSLRIRFDEAPPTPPPAPVAPPIKPVNAPEQSSYWTTGHLAGAGLLGLSAVALGFTVGFAVGHENNISDQETLAKDPRVCADSMSAGCRSFQSHGDSAHADTAGTIVSLALAVVAGISGAVLLWPSSTTTAHGQFHKFVLTTRNGAGLVGEF